MHARSEVNNYAGIIKMKPITVHYQDRIQVRYVDAVLDKGPVSIYSIVRYYSFMQRLVTSVT